MRKYLFPTSVGVCIGPHTSKWTSYSGKVGLHDASLRNASLLCFPNAHLSQISFVNLILESLNTISSSCNYLRLFMFRWSNLLWQINVNWHTLAFNVICILGCTFSGKLIFPFIGILAIRVVNELSPYISTLFPPNIS